MGSLLKKGQRPVEINFSKLILKYKTGGREGRACGTPLV